MSFVCTNFPMASYLRINSSQWPISFSLWPHFLQSLACPFCSCHTDLLPNSSLNSDAPNLDSVHLLGLLLPVLLLHMTEWLTPAPHSGLCSNVPSLREDSPKKYYPFLKPSLYVLTLTFFSASTQPRCPITCLSFTCQAHLLLEYNLPYREGLRYVHTRDSVA